MILTITDGKQTPQWSARVKLDFSFKTWKVDGSQTAWPRIGFSNQGSFEIQVGKSIVLWFWDRLDFRTKKNTVILWNPPTSSRDAVHTAGNGTLFEPKDPALKGQKIAWATAKETIRDAALELLKANLPPLGTYQDAPNWVEGTARKAESTNSDGHRATGCGGLVGQFYKDMEEKGWPIPKDRITVEYVWTPPRTQQKVKAKETVWLTGPTFAHRELALAIEKRRTSPIYIKFKPGDTHRPLPGDVYILRETPNGITRHEGVIQDASTNEWITADGGQGQSGFAVGFSKKKFDPATGLLSGGKEPGYVDGWIDLESLVKES